jgi:AbiU2
MAMHYEEAASKLNEFIRSGLLANLLRVDEALAIYELITVNAERLNNKLYGPFAANVQNTYRNQAVLILARIYDLQKNYPLHSIDGLLLEVQSLSQSLSLREPAYIERFAAHLKLRRQGSTDQEIIFNFARQLREKQSLFKDQADSLGQAAWIVKTLRNKTIAHSERIEEKLDGVSFLQLRTLSAYAHNVTGLIGWICGLVVCIQPDDFVMKTDAMAAAASIRKLLINAGVIEKSAPWGYADLR